MLSHSARLRCQQQCALASFWGGISLKAGGHSCNIFISEKVKKKNLWMRRLCTQRICFRPQRCTKNAAFQSYISIMFPSLDVRIKKKRKSWLKGFEAPSVNYKYLFPLKYGSWGLKLLQYRAEFWRGIQFLL